MKCNEISEVETLEKAKLNMDRLSVPFVDEMSDHVQFALSSSQNEWRQQLTGIMEVSLFCVGCNRTPRGGARRLRDEKGFLKEF